MSLVPERALSSREFLDECIAFKCDHAPRSTFLRRLVMGELNPAQVELWAQDFYYYVEPAIPTIAAWLASAPTLPDRSVYQLIVRFDDAPLAVSLSVVAALVYLVAAYCMRRRGARVWRVAVAACTFELVGVLTVGTVSVVSSDVFQRATVWSQYGSGYGFVPLVLPMLGLGWLLRRETRRDYGVA